MLYYLSLGANLGNKEATIQKALHMLGCSQWSSFYYSKAVDFESTNEFCNCCACVESKMKPLEFLLFTQQIERELGRKRKSVNGEHFDREIDIDILLAYPAHPVNLSTSQPICLSTPELTLPHPKMHNRPFVMLPLQEILQKNA